MDETTQQNAALVEEATAAARAMEEQAAQLADAVAIFRLDNQVAVAVKAVTAKVAPKAASPAPARPLSTPATIRRTHSSTVVSNDGDWQEF
ncbi:Methyl-accepting chemotaxis protein III [compost metagenome]